MIGVTGVGVMAIGQESAALGIIAHWDPQRTDWEKTAERPQGAMLSIRILGKKGQWPLRGGETLHCTYFQSSDCRIMWLSISSPGDLLTADIYWGLAVEPTTNALALVFAMWEPIISTIDAFAPPQSHACNAFL